ncbi:endonuclease/exonuclease/phosphatase family protein [Novosphingobium sp. FKTRR1]|uniref:endonuclease/exonuclease/phosphatase family protein n=1 Tax=Novosphingobium sp. FKTRR1 TaxID=2879118 RepID=UPI001CF0AFD8|nr:endonuclease/exonuclease/phosphatase family protein [Novosphingobium sp. FKTRR1]
MDLTFASYNIHKGVGADRRRDPERILAVLHELDADIIALQEADRRFGARAAVLSSALLADRSPWVPVAPRHRPQSLGWHGNVLLVRRSITVEGVSTPHLPTLEPRGAVCATLAHAGYRWRVAGMHLDLSGLRRRQQVRTICSHMTEGQEPLPGVLMGDLNEWSARGGALAAFAPHYHVLAPGRSFPARRPLGMLDRIVVSDGWGVAGCGVHDSALARQASDHLPVWARLVLNGARHGAPASTSSA